MLVTTLNYFTESPRKLRHLHRQTTFCIPEKRCRHNYLAKTLRFVVMNTSDYSRIKGARTSNQHNTYHRSCIYIYI